ncbi:photosystem II protein PsbQ [Umezakia ovalisporum]|jgi:photosystem II protein PsbQ|uniref:Photosystem II protein PsbQ n=2 Tax=Umezakia ovalisporum TaxID=75695 RepID=A0AA43GZX8_9CYAN|nr:photosystem II protein PsbQ [Umezakia ovalisporum]MBI1241415.1 photosystem II protein PsbQ [Nostoc sp. RI_552]MDH6057142.1 photosystem II protein PsbQ [Umezakia ovalisporum FSS-43]MDH6064591.1 photosystem II protein PsbQ [Umezakia ovalisporum FSS-62]MDH6067730.1 photosystem II protein PsbQ [Umezakia ovalisporum APH033B]MDH6071683.1 photosystem II protein PsbQ [Umezakia ovalisporum CobakiLakeA]
MARQPSIFSLILVLLATFLISCGGPSVAVAPPTYTETQLERIQEYVPKIQAVRHRAEELKTLINKKDWIDVSNFIHGPMTEARLSMTYIIPNLLASAQPTARQKTRDLLNHLVKIDQAAGASNSLQALNSYQEVVEDIDQFFQLLPDLNTQPAV